MKSFLAELSRRLEETDRLGLLRSLREPEGIDFASNDYLGLTKHPHLRECLVRAARDGKLSAPASRLLRGHDPAHTEAEERLAQFKGTEAALLFPSGYQANIAIATALIRPDDRAVSDALNHASMVDGLRLSGCTKAIYGHLDVHAADKLLQDRHTGGRSFLVSESYFSVDGDVAPLESLADAADRCGAALIVDDAHATGIFGEARGSGLCERFGIERRAAAILSTAGKSFGLWGAFVAGPKVVIDTIINKARAFIFTTAVSPLLVAGIHGALDILEQEPHLRERAHALACRLRAGLAAGRDVHVPPGEGPIVPVILGSNERAVSVAEEVRRRGFDVRAVRPPTVPAGTARLRLSVHADQTDAQIDDLASAVTDAAGRPDR